MLQALRQIESRSSGATPASSAAIEPAPSVDDLMDSAQQMWQQVETALATDQATSPGAVPPGETGVSPVPGATGVRSVLLGVPPAETAIATASTADPYGLLAATVLGQLPSTDRAALLFTSAGDGEGKTDVLARLAAALAQRLQGNVLAIDGNSRSPELSARLGVQSAVGLIEVLAGTASWHDVVRPTAIRGLSVLPVGGAAGNNGDNSNSGNNTAGLDPAALGTLLAELRNHYRLVLVDAAPLLYPEAAPLAAWCDGTYLVVRLGSTPRRAVGEAAAAIEQCQGRLRGCIAVD
jgi:Mrp family chromosome partitioning ATPase